MKPSINCVNLIKEFEGFRAKAYICPAGKVTIGWGTTLYPNGNKVKMGDTCTKEQAEIYLLTDLDRRAAAIGEMQLNQNQQDAILSLVYNIGITNWNASTIRKKVKIDPRDPTIRNEFARWNKKTVNGVLVVEEGLVRRRKAEADLYFS